MTDFKAPAPQQLNSSNPPQNTTQKEESKPLQAPPLPYEEPEWSEAPSKDFYFEIIKDGSILGKSGLVSAKYLVAGRLPNCDIELEHASASRYHAIIQFKGDACFIYDLASSHHTFLNKAQVEARKYVRVRVGDMLRFGASSRLYILAGDHQEAEKREEALLAQEAKRKVAAEETLEVAWGFKEDAYEGDEWGGVDVKSDVDRSLISSDSYYFEDPKKALTLFLDNNGAESQIAYQQAASTGVGPREFTATLEITGLQGPLSAAGKGKKKGHAERDAYLEACFKLDKLGILRLQQGSLADRNKRLREEYLEDDMDNYRDNSIDPKGKKQKQEAVVETLQTLTERRNIKLNEVENFKIELEKHKAGTAGDHDEEDELDAYMNQITQKVKKEEEKKTVKLILQAEKELAELEKLVDLATPKGFNQPKPSAVSAKPHTLNSIQSNTTVQSTKTHEKPGTTPKSPVKSKSPVNSKSASNDQSHPPVAASVKEATVKQPSRPVKGPSKAELSRHTLHRDEDVVDFVPPSTDESADELAKKAAARYGY